MFGFEWGCSVSCYPGEYACCGDTYDCISNGGSGGGGVGGGGSGDPGGGAFGGGGTIIVLICERRTISTDSGPIEVQYCRVIAL